MDSEQLEQKIEWLENNRRDLEDTIKRLEKRIDGLEEGQKQEAKHVQELGEDLLKVSRSAQKIGQMDEALAAHRKEVSRQLEASEKRRTEKEKSIEAVRKADLKSNKKFLDDIQSEVANLARLRDDFTYIQNQVNKATSERDALRSQNEATMRKVDDYVSQQSGHGEEIRVISRELGRADAEIANLTKLNTQIDGKVEAVEDRARRVEIRVAELAASEDERQQNQDRWLEKQNLQLVEYKHAWAEWERRFTTIESASDQLNERMAAYQTTYSKLKQMQTDLEEIILRLERRINEITEIQRLAENRQEQAWTKYQADNQKRWSTFKLNEDERWREHSRLHEKLATELEEDAARSRRTEEGVEAQRTRDAANMLALNEILQRWQDEMSEDLDGES